MELLLKESEVETIIAALGSYGHGELLHRVAQQLKSHRERTAAAVAMKQRELARRAERAANHTLTKAQAMALAAVRAGKYVSQRPYIYTNNVGERVWGWAHSRSMGGAVHRMIIRLVDEGMLDDNRRTLTPAGAARLEAWEARHGLLGRNE